MQWPLDAPLVCGFSTNYYWTFGIFGLVCVPSGEGLTLLGLPDLCHELGHILHLHREPQLMGDFIRELLAYVDQEKRRAALAQRPQSYQALFDPLLDHWRDKWLLEFVADMVATYLLGPAYGWQHVRLCATTGQPAYRPVLGEAADHPANEARLRGALAVLERAGANEAGARVLTLWHAYVSVVGECKPADYDVCYPPALIQSLARRVVDGCAALGIRRFDDLATAGGGAGGTDVAQLLGEAWMRFITDPPAYAQWEPGQRDALWRELGLTAP